MMSTPIETLVIIVVVLLVLVFVDWVERRS